jgi:D-beta-D-heptose 7-phosphate kinase/D-beta-D-heptose 1-phosphate adenosyltransferase
MRNKITSEQDLLPLLQRHRQEGKRIVMTNGCFDLLHLGHIRYLQEARRQGDLLVVALNSDRSMRAIKGPKRPLIPEEERAEILAALACVDYVVLFDEPDPLRLIQAILPHTLAKGGDWTPDRIVGREVVEQAGGRVLSIPLTPGKSTTTLIERILERYK